MIDNITCDGISARYNKKQPFITNNIHFSVQSGEVMAIMEPSGSGKSTLLNAVLGKLPIEDGKGRTYINGQDVTDAGLAYVKDQVGFVPQKDILVDELTVRENDLERNVKVAEMDLRQPGDFLAKSTGNDAPGWLDVILPDSVEGSKTYVLNGIVLLGLSALVFLSTEGGSAWSDSEETDDEAIISSTSLAKTVYWTGDNYRGRSDVLWALAVCVRPPETGK